MHANKAIRDAIRQQIAAAYSAGEVFTGRVFDLRGTQSPESVQVYLQSGNEQGQDMAFEYRSELKIIVRKVGLVHDDELDAIAIAVDSALGADTSLGGIVHGITYDSFEYLEDAEGNNFSALLINYIVIH